MTESEENEKDNEREREMDGHKGRNRCLIREVSAQQDFDLKGPGHLDLAGVNHV